MADDSNVPLREHLDGKLAEVKEDITEVRHDVAIVSTKVDGLETRILTMVTWPSLTQAIVILCAISTAVTAIVAAVILLV